jgi:hypothetical protein
LVEFRDALALKDRGSTLREHIAVLVEGVKIKLIVVGSKIRWNIISFERIVIVPLQILRK